MRMVIFWVFIALFVIVVCATLGLIFFGFGSPTAEERSLLFNVFIGEVGAAVIALFYSLFGLRKDVAPNEGEQIKNEVTEKLNAKMREVDAKVEHATAGILMVQGDMESSQSKHCEAAVSYIHAATHAVLSNDISFTHEVLKELLHVKLPKVTKPKWAKSPELQADLSRLIDRLPELCNGNNIEYALRELREFKTKLGA